MAGIKQNADALRKWRTTTTTILKAENVQGWEGRYQVWVYARQAFRCIISVLKCTLLK